MRRLLLLLAVPVSLLFVLSCDPDEQDLNYIDFMGSRHQISAAMGEVFVLGDNIRLWYVEIGTGDLVAVPAEGSWMNSGLLATTGLFIGQDNYDFTYIIVEGSDPGTLSDFTIYPDWGVSGEGYDLISDERSYITVSKTGDLYVVEFHVYVSNDGGETRVPATGRIIGSIPEVNFSLE